LSAIILPRNSLLWTVLLGLPGCFYETKTLCNAADDTGRTDQPAESHRENASALRHRQDHPPGAAWRAAEILPEGGLKRTDDFLEGSREGPQGHRIAPLATNQTGYRWAAELIPLPHESAQKVPIFFP